MSVPCACSALPCLLYQQTPVHPLRPSSSVFSQELYPSSVLSQSFAHPLTLPLTTLGSPPASELLMGRCWAPRVTGTGTSEVLCLNLAYLFGFLLRVICVVFHLPCAVCFLSHSVTSWKTGSVSLPPFCLSCSLSLTQGCGHLERFYFRNPSGVHVIPT